MKLTLIILGAVLMASSAFAQTPHPFKVGIELPTNLPVDSAVEFMLKDVGVNYLNFYVYNDLAPVEQDPVAVYDAQAALAKRLGAEYQLACHHRDIPEAVVRKAAQDPLCTGVLLDEPEHIRLLWRGNSTKAPKLAETDDAKDLFEAHDRVVAGWKALGDKYRSWGIKNLTSTHVWPVLLSVAAEGGWNPAPKICKEFYSPVSLAIGMGAALQYDKPLMVDCDLWFWDLLPGHTPEEYRSNLLLAYWSGADGVYTEGAGHNFQPAGRQGLPHSLMAKISDAEYALSPHGEILKWFIKEYIPTHPRVWSFRDIKPDIAIIRFDDSCYGQRHNGIWMPDALYGSVKLHSDADTEAIFQVWNVLTGGETGIDGISKYRATSSMSSSWATFYHQRDSYLTRPMMANSHNFFVPLNNVVVFDDNVSAERLSEIPCLVLTGKRISPKTWLAVQARVQQGATCVIWAPLAAKLGLKPAEGVTKHPMGKGMIWITDDFGLTQSDIVLGQFRGRADQIRYRFTHGEVVLKQVDANKVEVQTTVYPKP
ncbi:MAG: hypothetical protein ACYC1M_17330 [Armatimonadota bacterium]